MFRKCGCARCRQSNGTLEPCAAAAIARKLCEGLAGLRTACGAARQNTGAFQQPRWDGSQLDGKTILVYAERGLGDSIQFARFLPMVQRRGGEVLLECQPCVVDLLAGIPGVRQVVAAGVPIPPFDVQIPLLSLPGLLGTTLATVPADIPYLEVDPRRVAYWQGEIRQAATHAQPFRRRSCPARRYLLAGE